MNKKIIILIIAIILAFTVPIIPDADQRITVANWIYNKLKSYETA